MRGGEVDGGRHRASTRTVEARGRGIVSPRHEFGGVAMCVPWQGGGGRGWGGEGAIERKMALNLE